MDSATTALLDLLPGEGWLVLLALRSAANNAKPLVLCREVAVLGRRLADCGTDPASPLPDRCHEAASRGVV